MSPPDTVLKHDGRKVPFEAWRLEASVRRAACDSDATLVADAAARLGRQVAGDVAEAALAEGKHVIATADIRSLAAQALRSLKLETVASAYMEHARAASMLLWRVRVIEPAMQRAPGSGSPWDRRRLLESLRASGVGHDMAGWVAREVERRVVTLGMEYVSPALIHALAMLTLPPDAYGARAYSVRRVAFSAAANLPNWSDRAGDEHPLPSAGAALEQFWMQGVHSAPVIQAARHNLLSLEPYPTALNEISAQVTRAPGDPCEVDFAEWIAQNIESDASPLLAFADTPARLDALAEILAQKSGTEPNAAPPRRALTLLFKSLPQKYFDAAQRAMPVTLNAGGLIARESLRDLDRACARLAELAALAAQAHREREDYFLRSPVRGRILPIALAGLWNAAAAMLGEPFDAAQPSHEARRLVEKLCQSARDAVAALRGESGMALALTGAAPLAAERRLWHNDRDYFLRDGITLHDAGAYEISPALKLSAGVDDFTSRVDFAKALSAAFDEPPPVVIEVPPIPDAEAAQWKELLEALSKAALARVLLRFTGAPRAVINLSRALKSYLIGFPLLEGLTNEFPQ